MSNNLFKKRLREEIKQHLHREAASLIERASRQAQDGIVAKPASRDEYTVGWAFIDNLIDKV